MDRKTLHICPLQPDQHRGVRCTPLSIIKKEGGQNIALDKQQEIIIKKERDNPPSKKNQGGCGTPPWKIIKEKGGQSTPLYSV